MKLLFHKKYSDILYKNVTISWGRLIPATHITTFSVAVQARLVGRQNKLLSTLFSFAL